MKIFFFGSDYSPTTGGIATHTTEWVKAIAKIENLQAKARIFGNRNPRREMIGRLEVTTEKSVGFFYVGWKIFLDILAHRNYDVFHAFNLFPVGFWTVFWSLFFGKKSVLTFYGADACDTRSSRKTLFLQRFALKYATWAVTISEFTKAAVMKRYGLSDQNIHVISPILPTIFKSQKEIKHEDLLELKKKWGIHKEDFVIVAVSRLVERKGFQYLIKAIAEINDPHVKAIIVGDGVERPRLEALVEELNLSKRVCFTGKVPEVWPYYMLANVAALVSYQLEKDGDFEGLGLVLLEAQSYRLPVIGTRSGGIPEAIEEGKTGVVVAEKNPEAIAQAILALKNDPALYQAMRARTRTFLDQKFGYFNTVKKYLRLLGM